MNSYDPPRRLAELRQLRDHVLKCVQCSSVSLHVEPQTIAPVAQIIEYLHRRLGQRGLIYYPRENQGQWAAARLRDVGIKAGAGSAASAAFSTGEVDVRVCTTGKRPHIWGRDIRFVLHATPPRSLNDYWADLSVLSRDSVACESVMFYSPHDLRGYADIMRYCRRWICRYAQIVRLKKPQLAIPAPHEFCCYRCDVCISQPRGYTEDNDDTVTVPLRETRCKTSTGCGIYRCKTA